MSGRMLTVQETAALLRGMDDVLLLTHVRPAGDTVGSAAALCVEQRLQPRELSVETLRTLLRDKGNLF